MLDWGSERGDDLGQRGQETRFCLIYTKSTTPDWGPYWPRSALLYGRGKIRRLCYIWSLQILTERPQIVDFVVWLLFRAHNSTSGRPRNLLCHGLQRASAPAGPGDHEGGITTFLPGIARYHPNESLDKMKSIPWANLPSLLGADAEVIISSLLLDCGVFTRVNSGTANLFQLSGTPISELPQIQLRLPQPSTSQTARAEKVSIARIRFVRNRILYAKPSFNAGGQIKCGFHHTHVLQRCRQPLQRCDAVHILKYIFPRQFGLHNVFTSSVDPTETVHQFKDYTFREQEINAHPAKKSQTWVPRRLRGEALQLVRNLHRNHRRCSYSQLLRHYCPIQPWGSELDAALHRLRSTFLPSSEPWVTQVHSSGTSNEVSNPSPTSHDTEASFLPHSTPSARVSAFCRAVIARLLPPSLLGHGLYGQRNLAILRRRIDEFVTMRRFESGSLHEVVQGIHIGSISWLACPSRSSEKMSRTDYLKRHELLCEILYYIFDSLLIPLIRAHFYVTESSTHRNRLFYFRHDVWRKLSEPSLAALQLSMYTPIQPGQARHKLQSRTLGHSHLRLLPKDQGARPITNLRRRQLNLVSGKRILGTSINAQLGSLFSVLNFERGRNPAPLGSALLSVGDLHARLAGFKNKIPAESRLFFAKVDIKSCFDSIPQAQLLPIVRSLFAETSYRITKHIELKSRNSGRSENGQSLGRRFLGLARSADDTTGFSESTVANMASRKRHVVFADTGNNRVWTRSSLLKLLHDHIQDSLVKIGKKYMKQVDGIPQGSVLSSLLCSYFYGAFEQTELGFLDPESSLLLRLIDDFLLITTDENLARRFLEVMAAGNARYGILVNAEKSLSNFDVAIEGRKVPRVHGSTFFPYCGMAIEMGSLELQKDRSKKDAYVSNTLTVDTCSRPGTTLRRKVLSSLKLQMHAMLLDMSLNSRQRVVGTLMANFTESAMKMHRYKVSLPPKKQPTQEAIRELIKDLIAATTKICWTKNKQHQHIRHVNKAQMSWVAASAFERVLLRKQSQYTEVLAWLHALREITRPRMNMEEARLAQMLDENDRVFRDYVY